MATEPRNTDWQGKLSDHDKDLLRRLNETCDLLAKADIQLVSVVHEGSIFTEVGAMNSTLEIVAFPSGELEQALKDSTRIRFFPSWGAKGTWGMVKIWMPNMSLDVTHKHLRGGLWAKRLEL